MGSLCSGNFKKLAEKRRYSVLTVLLAGFSVTSILGVGIALYVGLGTAYQNTRNLWVMLSDLDLTSVQRTMHERMDNVGKRATWVADQVASGSLDPSFQYGWNNAMDITPTVAQEMDSLLQSVTLQ